MAKDITKQEIKSIIKSTPLTDDLNDEEMNEIAEAMDDMLQYLEELEENPVEITYKTPKKKKKK